MFWLLFYSDLVNGIPPEANLHKKQLQQQKILGQIRYRAEGGFLNSKAGQFSFFCVCVKYFKQSFHFPSLLSSCLLEYSFLVPSFLRLLLSYAHCSVSFKTAFQSTSWRPPSNSTPSTFIVQASWLFSPCWTLVLPFHVQRLINVQQSSSSDRK